MSFSVFVGSLGVSLLLVAFFLNLFRFVRQDSHIYIFLNIVGAGISGYASWLIHYWPFVILEGAWCLAAVAGAIRSYKLQASSFKPEDGMEED
jgi:hypothetical protein